MINLPHLDLNITTVCNYRCASCSHASPFSEPYWMEPAVAWADLNSLRHFVNFDMICLVGGEPTLHPRLLEFLDLAREVEIAKKVCVVTNGSRLAEMRPEFWKKIDVLRVSVYGRADAMMPKWAEERCEEHDIEFHAWSYPEFFKQLKATPDDGVESFRTCEWKSDCYTVHEGRFYLCPQSAFFPKRFMGKPSTAGLPLGELTEERLQMFLDRSEPFEACKICLAGAKVAAPWREANKKEWQKLSTG